jgi:hypothetical protein
MSLERDLAEMQALAQNCASLFRKADGASLV